MSEAWNEFINKNMCSLCAQWGYIDTRGIKTPGGFECGKLNYCICPNGREMKKKICDISIIIKELKVCKDKPK